MSENWASTIYRERAKAWRERAASFPEEDPRRVAYVQIAEGYERLAVLLEERGRFTRRF